MAVGVGSGADGGVAGRGLGVGVVVVAVGEVGAFVEEETEAAAFEIGAIAVEVVGAKLIDDEDDDQLGMGVVGAGQTRGAQGITRKTRSNVQTQRLGVDMWLRLVSQKGSPGG